MKLAYSPRTLAAAGVAVVVIGTAVATVHRSRAPEPGLFPDAAIGRLAGFGTDMAQGAPMVAAAPAAAPPKAAILERGAQESETFRQPAATQAMIIRNAGVEIQVDSLELAIAAVRRLATSLGGHIGSMNAHTGEHQVRGATLVMRIPAQRFDSAMNGMPSLGRILNSSATAEDMGEEHVDVTARVANARRLENRLLTLLATRTGKLQDVLTVERELARVRQEIERYEGRLHWIGAQVAMSTISVNVHEKAPIVATPGQHPIRDAFALAWRNFVGLVATVIAASGVVVPVAVLALTGFGIWRRVRGRTLAAE